MQQKQAGSSPQLSRTPGSLVLWGMAVGYVIPGMYSGWNLGLKNLKLHVFPVDWVAISFTIRFFLGIEQVAITANSGWGYYLLITTGLMGLVGSFHGIILEAGRATFESGRVKYIRQSFGKVHTRFNTRYNPPARILYILSTMAVLMLRKKEPQMLRPSRIPLCPVFPIVPLLIVLVSLIAIIKPNGKLALIYSCIPALAYIWFHFVVKKSLNVSPVNK